MKNLKRLQVLSISTALLFSATACGNENETDPEKKNETNAEEKTSEEEKESAEDNEKKEKISITFWHAMGGTPNGEITQELIDDFNASQDKIVVTGEYQGSYDDTITKLKASIQSGDIPDICQMYDVGTKFMIDSGCIVPVEDMFELTGYDKNTVMETITNYYSVDGKQYSMPFNVSTPILFYNKDVFQAAGLDPEAPPTTYDEVLAYSKKIVESGAAPAGYAQAIYGWFFEQQLAGLGAYYGDHENGRAGDITAVEFDKNGAGLKVFQMWKELYDSGYFANYGTSTADSETAFYSGQTAMIVQSTAAVKNAAISSNFDVGTGYFPKVEANEEGGVIIGGGSLWLMDTQNQEKEEAAWKFIEFLTSAEEQAKLSMATGYFAINPDAYELEEMKQYLEENPNFLTAINQLKETPTNLYTSGVLSAVQTEARLLFNDIMAEVYENTKTPEQGVAALAEKVNAAIENYNASIK